MIREARTSTIRRIAHLRGLPTYDGGGKNGSGSQGKPDFISRGNMGGSNNMDLSRYLPKSNSRLFALFSYAIIAFFLFPTRHAEANTNNLTSETCVREANICYKNCSNRSINDSMNSIASGLRGQRYNSGFNAAQCRKDCSDDQSACFADLREQRAEDARISSYNANQARLRSSIKNIDPDVRALCTGGSIIRYINVRIYKSKGIAEIDYLAVSFGENNAMIVARTADGGRVYEFNRVNGQLTVRHLGRNITESYSCVEAGAGNFRF